MAGSNANVFDTEILLLQIEELFDRFKNLPLNSRAVILEKIRIKLLEEFKDFVIQENDGIQETIFEIPFGNNSEIEKNENLEELTNTNETYHSDSINNSGEDDYYPLMQSPMIIKPVDNSKKPTKQKILKPKTASFMCNYCGKQFNRKNVFNLHLDRHKNERTISCPKCSLRFNVKDDLMKHLKSHSNERNFVCSICSKQLVNNSTLQNHIRVMHEKDEKYICHKCDYFAYSKHTLREHIRMKHEKLFKKYACIICKNIYNSKVLLKVHLRSHTGEKPYKCKECTAAFTCSGRLTNHNNSVHGERKYNCEVCEKSFKTIHKLKRHSYIHTRIKPFACPFCTNYASNTQGNLTKHVKTVHQMNDFSYLKYKRRMQGELEEIKEEYIKNAESFTNEYLKKLSDNGNTLIINK